MILSYGMAHHDRVMQLNWLYFCGICQPIPLNLWPNTAQGCNHQSTCMPQLQHLCSAALEPNVQPWWDVMCIMPCVSCQVYHIMCIVSYVSCHVCHVMCIMSCVSCHVYRVMCQSCHVHHVYIGSHVCHVMFPGGRRQSDTDGPHHGPERQHNVDQVRPTVRPNDDHGWPRHRPPPAPRLHRISDDRRLHVLRSAYRSIRISRPPTAGTSGRYERLRRKDGSGSPGDPAHAHHAKRRHPPMAPLPSLLGLVWAQRVCRRSWPVYKRCRWAVWNVRSSGRPHSSSDQIAASVSHLYRRSQTAAHRRRCRLSKLQRKWRHRSWNGSTERQTEPVDHRIVSMLQRDELDQRSLRRSDDVQRNRSKADRDRALSADDVSQSPVLPPSSIVLWSGFDRMRSADRLRHSTDAPSRALLP